MTEELTPEELEELKEWIQTFFGPRFDAIQAQLRAANRQVRELRDEIAEFCAEIKRNTAAASR